MAKVIDKLRRDAESLSTGRHSIVIEADGHVDLRGSEPELVSAFTKLVANAVRYTPTGGTGLGLAIVKHTLSRHQAQLDIKSTPGIGSRFAALFPANRVAGL